MDPITAIGLASAIVTFVDIGTKIAKRLEELSQAGDVPKVFRAVQTRLPLVLQIVERTRDAAQSLSPTARTSIEEVVRDCYRHLAQLDEILKKVTVQENDSRWRKGAKAVVSLIEEGRVERIATALKDNVQLLTSLNVAPAEKGKTRERESSVPLLPTYQSAQVHFVVPFEQDEHFVGRDAELSAIYDGFKKQNRTAIAGMGGVGKSQIAIEFCYRHRKDNPLSHVFWVWGGNVSRFQQGYQRIAEALELPGWDDPEADVLELVRDSLSKNTMSYMLVLDNADSMENWWPSKYESADGGPEPSEDLSKYLPDCAEASFMLITTRDTRIASRLVKRGKPISVQPMSIEDARQLFLSKAEDRSEDSTDEDVNDLVQKLDYLPLAISQAAAYLEENAHYTISEYLDALTTDNAEEFLQEELHDSRRDPDSLNSIFRTLKLSLDQIRVQKPKSADLLCMLSMLDRQSIPKSLLTSDDETKQEMLTALGTLTAFNLVLLRANKTTFQLHRLVQKFVQSYCRKAGTLGTWRAAALKCVVKAYPVEIGAAEYEVCDNLEPHVLALIDQSFQEDAAKLDLAHLLCWSADFAVEKNQVSLALKRAKRSLEIFQRLVPENDERRASSSWMYGRLLYYEARSDEDMDNAARILEDSLRIATYPSMTFAESAFELAHLYFDHNNEQSSLKMGKASYECWRDVEGPNSERALDNLDDYALELALFDHEAEAIEKWNEVISRIPKCEDSDEDTRKLFEFRSLAQISEFSSDAALAEIWYDKLITLCGAIYNEHHIHVFDYRLCHSEQVLRQGRLEEAEELARDVLSSCQNTSHWQIRASSLQIMAECRRRRGDLAGEEVQRMAAVELHERKLARSREETMAAIEAYAHCLTRAGKFRAADSLWREVIGWRRARLGPDHSATLRAVVCRGVCEAAQSRDAEAEKMFLSALEQDGDGREPDLILLENICAVSWNQKNWEQLETFSRRALHALETTTTKLASSVDDTSDEDGASRDPTSTRWGLIVALEQQHKVEEALALRAENLELEDTTMGDLLDIRRVCVAPPLPLRRRFGRMIHPRTWSA